VITAKKLQDQASRLFNQALENLDEKLIDGDGIVRDEELERIKACIYQGMKLLSLDPPNMEDAIAPHERYLAAVAGS
jgi:hypothetical protein